MRTSKLFAIIFLTLTRVFSQNNDVIHLWPEEVPGQSESKAPSSISENTDGNVIRIDKVTDPSLTIYEANPERHNGAAVIICPGGGYNILAADKEGYEVADWISDLGYTAFVLHYRVPKQRKGALQDAQRAIKYVRGMSRQWNIDSDKIGLIGFSAGGSLSARASTLYNEESYSPIDEYDIQSARPDFVALIYPAYLDQGMNKTITAELKVNSNTPPMFLFVAGDDRYANSSLVMSSELLRNQVPFELHVQPEGGHGFGLRPGKRAAETWPRLCEEWLQLTVFGKKETNAISN